MHPLGRCVQCGKKNVVNFNECPYIRLKILSLQNQKKGIMNLIEFIKEYTKGKDRRGFALGTHCYQQCKKTNSQHIS